MLANFVFGLCVRYYLAIMATSWRYSPHTEKDASLTPTKHSMQRESRAWEVQSRKCERGRMRREERGRAADRKHICSQVL